MELKKFQQMVLLLMNDTLSMWKTLSTFFELFVDEISIKEKEDML